MRSFQLLLTLGLSLIAVPVVAQEALAIPTTQLGPSIDGGSGRFGPFSLLPDPSLRPSEVECLLTRGLEARDPGRHRATPLMLFAKCGEARLVRQLLRDGADPHARDDFGSTALMYAAEAGHRDVVSALLPVSDIEARSERDWTALFEAAASGHASCLRDLLHAGANARWTTSYGETALSVVDPHSTECVRTLLASGAGRERTAMNYALYNCAACEYGTRSLRLLLAAGADPNPGKGFNSPLHAAACGGGSQTARVLVKAGANLEDPGPSGITPLLLAIRNGLFDVALELIRLGADVKARDTGELDAGCTALHFAARRWWAEGAQLLIRRGVDPAALDSDGGSALDEIDSFGEGPEFQPPAELFRLLGSERPKR